MPLDTARAVVNGRAGSCPLRVGLALSGPTDPGHSDAMLELATWADAVGLDSLWLPEHHFRPGATSAPLLMLAAFAARTRRVRLATTSLLITVREPRRVANEVASLDRLSNGRVVLGLGRGFDAKLLRAFGVDPRLKRDRFDAALDAILATWADARDDGARPLPVQRPHPPLMVAAFGPKALAQAGRRGLPYLASPLETLEALEHNQALHREALPSHVDPIALGVPVMRTVHVAANGAEAKRVAAEIERDFAQLVARGARSLAAQAAGAGAQRSVVGEAGAVAEQLSRYRERLGMDLVVVRPAPGLEPGEVRRSLERLLERVLPALD